MEESGKNETSLEVIQTGVEIIKEQESAAGMAFLEAIIHKFAPQIQGMNKNIADYLGDNEKIIILRRLNKDSDPVVITFDTTKYLEISFNKPGEAKTVFRAGEGAALNSRNVGDFLQNLLTGNFDKIE